MMSDAWAKAIAEIAALLKRWGAPLFAFFAGQKAQKQKERARDDKAKIEDLERRIDAAQGIDRASRDDAERQRVRDEYTRPDPPPG